MKEPNTHKIETFTDILNATNSDNIDDFLADMKMIILGLKFTNGVDEELELPSHFTWIDDGKHDINLTIIQK